MSKLKLIIGNKTYSSWSLRPWIALRHFDIPFEEVVIPLDQPDTTQRILQYSPTARVPVLQMDDITVWDSIAILATVSELYPEKSFYPKDKAARALARAISAEMHAGFADLRKFCPMNFCRAPKLRAAWPEGVQKDVARIAHIWKDMLGRFDGPFLCGKEFCIADAMYAPVVNRFHAYMLSQDETVQAYIDTIRALPAWKEWEQAARAEPWRNADTDSLA